MDCESHQLLRKQQKWSFSDKKKAAHNESKLSPKKDKEDTALTGNMEQGNFWK